MIPLGSERSEHRRSRGAPVADTEAYNVAVAIAIVIAIAIAIVIAIVIAIAVVIDVDVVVATGGMGREDTVPSDCVKDGQGLRHVFRSGKHAEAGQLRKASHPKHLVRGGPRGGGGVLCELRCSIVSGVRCLVFG